MKNQLFIVVFAFLFAFCAAACSPAPTSKAFRLASYSPIPNESGSAFKADVNNRVSAVDPISPQVQLLNGSSINGTINVMASPYSAKCNGVTDDTAAIQEASIAAFATHVALLIPGHCVVSQLNWTNYNANSGKYIDVMGYNGDNTTNTQSALICREAAYNTGVCVDMTGAEYATIQHVAISSSGAGLAGTCAASKTCPPKVSFLLATKKFVPTQNSNVIDLEGVYVDNVGGGDYSVYDYGGEVFHATHYYFHGGNVAALLLSNNNSAGIASPFLGALPAPPISMTSVRLLDGALDTYGASSWVVLLDPGPYQMSDITIDGGYANTAGVGPGFIGDLSGGGSIHNLTVNNIRYEPGGNTAVFAKFANQVEGVQMTNDIFAPGNFTPMGAVVQFNDAAAVSVAGGNISIRPADGQGNFFNTIVSCISSVGLTIHDIDATGGAPTHNNCPGAIEFYQGAIMTKLAAAPGAALGAGHCEMFTVAGTNAGTCKIQAICGTSTTPVSIMDNIGSGC